MPEQALTEREAPLRAAYAAGQLDAVTRLSFALYGREISSFLCARLRSYDHGQEAFAMFAEELWVRMPTFRWQCSMRCWMYILARSAAHRYLTTPQQRPERNEPLSRHVSALAAHDTVRSITKPHHDSEVQQRMRALRERLEPADQSLLILRVDRQLAWRELALIMHEASAPLEVDAVERAAAKLRKRFERVKAELRAMAIEEGLLPR
jgi:RNA polymerase sigma-70 factor, ECF subfamily